MKDKVILSVEEYDMKMKRLVQLERAALELQTIKAKLTSLIDSVMDDEMVKCIDRNYTWCEPESLPIGEVAKIIGHDWDDMLENWKAERNQALLMKKDPEPAKEEPKEEEVKDEKKAD